MTARNLREHADVVLRIASTVVGVLVALGLAGAAPFRPGWTALALAVAAGVIPVRRYAEGEQELEGRSAAR